MLVNLVESVLSAAGWPAEVKTGSLMFDLVAQKRFYIQKERC